jgi:hypothetical protein
MKCECGHIIEEGLKICETCGRKVPIIKKDHDLQRISIYADNRKSRIPLEMRRGY